MKKEPPTTYRVGSLREFVEWTKSDVRDPESANGVPKRWFDSKEIAAPLPDWLQKAWAGARRRGIDALTPEDIDAEITAQRRETKSAAPEDK
jgi:hypothetical protein